MFGILRFMLALLVMGSHLPGNYYNFNMGVMAVIIFYMLSGFYMEKSYSRFKQYSDKPIQAFYLDRIIKLMPLYILLVILTFVSLSYLGESQKLEILNQTPDLTRVLYNIMLIPVNFVFEPWVINALLPHPIVPPAWSLATEAMFYLLVPLLYFLKDRAFRVFAVFMLLSIVIQVMATIGLFPGSVDALGYRYLPGVLVFFMIGMTLQRVSAYTSELFKVYLAIWLLLIVVIIPMLDIVNKAWQQEIWLAALIGPLIIKYFQSLVVSAKIRKWDITLGKMAYPVFLSHFFIFYILEQLFILKGGQYSLQLYWVLSVCLVIMISFFLSFIQTAIDTGRVTLRGFSSLRKIKSH